MFLVLSEDVRHGMQAETLGGRESGRKRGGGSSGEWGLQTEALVEELIGMLQTAGILPEQSRE